MAKLQAGARSLRHMRSQGYIAEMCEQFKARVEGRGQMAVFAGGYHKDLYGFADIMAFNATEVVAVQTTSKKLMSAHMRAYRRDEATRAKLVAWLASPARRFIVHGWKRVELPTKSGGIKHRWQVTEIDVSVNEV